MNNRMTIHRQYSLSDRVLEHADNMLRTLFASPEPNRPSPAGSSNEDSLSEWEIDESKRLMRVNHTGEVCAQALYQGQSVTARDSQLRETFQEAAEEENDHLAWCEHRIKSLGGRTSVLNPFFYASSFAIGAVVGLLGDRTSAAFLAETEYQVVDHLDDHLNRLPVTDKKSSKILTQMQEDELKHAKTAEHAGTKELPDPVKGLMKLMSKFMTRSSYWI